MDPVNPDQLAEIVRRLWIQFVAIAYGICQNWEDAQDIVLDAVIRVMRALPALSVRRDVTHKLDGFLAVAVRNAALEFLRKKKSKAEVVVPADNLSDRPHIEERVLVQELIAQLSPSRRRVIECFLAGLTPQETATELGITLNNQYVTYHRAIEDLRRLLDQAPRKLPNVAPDPEDPAPKIRGKVG